MEFSVSKEAFVFLCSALCGGLLFLLYDLFRVIRQKSGAGETMIHVQDGLFWLMALAVMFFMVLYVNNGTVRFYELFGAILGAVIYGLTLSRWILRFFCWFLGIFSVFFGFFFKILLTPLLFTYNIMYRCLCFVFLPMKKLGKRIGRQLLDSIKRTVRFSKKK